MKQDQRVHAIAAMAQLATAMRAFRFVIGVETRDGFTKTVLTERLKRQRRNEIREHEIFPFMVV